MATEQKRRNADRLHLEIYTLGRFIVRYGDIVFTENLPRSRKLWQLFIHLLMNHGREIPAETIITQLWDEDENADPGGALHNLIYRLRQLFHKLPCDEAPVTIEYSQVGYLLQLGPNAWYDLEDFLSLSQRASSAQHTDPADAIESYYQALSLYSGHYLPGRSSQPLVLSARRQYRRVFIDSLRGLVDLLRRPARYAEIVEVCEKALSIELFLEIDDIHYWFMEALAKLGREEDALEHYKMISRRLHADYARQPSKLMQRGYLMIRDRKDEFQNESLDLPLGSIRELLLGPDEFEGAYLCDRDFFRFLLRLGVRQRSSSSRSLSFLGLITITTPDGQHPRQGIRTRAAAELQRVLIAKLRHGDVICQWNEGQYLVLLSHSDQKTLEKCCDRVKEAFEQAFGSADAILLCHFEAL